MSDDKITRSELLRTGVVGLGVLTLLSTLVGSGCARERLAGPSGPPKTDPHLIGYWLATSFETHMHWPRGLAWDGKTLWVAGDMEVAQFGLGGTRYGAHTLLGAAKCVACGTDGALFTATDDQVISLAPKAATWASLGPRARIVSLAIDETHVWAGDAGNRQVVRYDRSGHIETTFGHKNNSYPGLIVPSPYLGMALDTAGDLWVTNIGQHRVERHSADGTMLASVGMPGMGMDAFCGCCNPTHLSILPNGDLVTSEKGLPRVKVICQDGKLKCVVAGPEQFHAETLGLATAVVGDRIAVLNPWEGEVRFYAPLGNAKTT